MQDFNNSQKRILVLEDDPARMIVFRRYARKHGHELYHETSVDSAQLTYDTDKPFAAIFLDHDLDGRTYVSSNEPNTGYSFAQYLRSVGDTTQTIVHSMNSVGSRNICAELPHAVHIPFHILKDSLLA